ncbi:MAG: putative dsRNA-binding protein predicted ribosome maturation factor [Nitrospira sp.]|jgi:L-threonylcarbamoyladenylate synthase|nr:putative dsRNA-binding protein predicted ribosome maturation factor [Nitrospira sp.]
MALVLPFTDTTFDATLPVVQRVLAAHGVMALPTETYYGLAVCPIQESALRRLFELKERPAGKPILLLIGSRDQLDHLVASIPPAARLLMDLFWPGPLTIVLPAASGLSPLLTGGTGSIGIRISPLPLLRRLLAVTGPLTGTSANRTSELPPDHADDVQQELGPALDLILDSGRTPGGLASTVIDARESPLLLRAGALSTDVIRAALASQGYALSS